MSEGEAPKKGIPKKKRAVSTDKLEALQERLYARGGGTQKTKRTKLSRAEAASKKEVPQDWETLDGAPRIDEELPQKSSPSVDSMRKQPVEVRAAVRPPEPEPEIAAREPEHTPMPQKKRSSRKYRSKILIAAAVFFFVTIALASVFLIWGNQGISGANITIDVEGAFAVGGGEEMPLRIAISNQNNVPIESTTLIISYPPGTQSVEEPGKEIFSERQQLGELASGEVRNIETSAIIFGEENDEKIINVSVEYRVRGSNATFQKDAEPLRFKISSSPVVLNIDAVESITSGQELEIELEVVSNAPTPLQDVLVTARYPFGFDYSSSDPEPVAANNTWRIDTLEPEETKTITVTGIVTGGRSDERVFDFSVGVPSDRDRFALASVFTTGSTEVALEDPFLGVEVEIEGSNDDVVIVESGRAANVQVTFTNTLDDTVYEGEIEVVLSGNALNDITVSSRDGFYNSQTNTITYDAVDESSLREIAPGRSSSVSFSLEPDESISRTPEVELFVTVRGQRVFEDRVPQQLTATASRVMRVESITSLSSSATHSGGPFSNSGPMPPVAEETTELTLEFALQSGSNDLTSAVMTAVLPQYVSWLSNVSSGDTISYNPSTRMITWNIGDVAANKTARASAQISVTPSTPQIGTIPTIIETQRFRATDRFTGTVVRAEAPALTTATTDDDSGRVRSSE